MSVSSSGSGATSSSTTLGPACSIAHLDVDRLADRRAERRDLLAVAPHFERDRLARIGGVEHARADRLVLADNAEARRLDQLDAPVALAFMAGDERMQRRLEAERGDDRRECHGRRRR